MFGWGTLVSAFLDCCGCQRLIGDAGWVLGLVVFEGSLWVCGDFALRCGVSLRRDAGATLFGKKLGKNFYIA